MLEFLELRWGQIVITITCASFIFAYIFSKNFRDAMKDAVGSAEIFGIISVDGFAIVVIFGLFIGGVYLFEPDQQEILGDFIEDLPAEVRKDSNRETRAAIHEMVRQVGVLESRNQELNEFIDQLDIDLSEYIEVYYNLDVTFVDSTREARNRIVHDLEAELKWDRISSIHVSDFRRAYDNLPFRVVPIYENHPPETKIIATGQGSSDLNSNLELRRNLESGRWIVNDNDINNLDEYTYLIRLRSSRYTATNLEEGNNHANYQIIKVKLPQP